MQLFNRIRIPLCAECCTVYHVLPHTQVQLTLKSLRRLQAKGGDVVCSSAEAPAVSRKAAQKLTNFRVIYDSSRRIECISTTKPVDLKVKQRGNKPYTYTGTKSLQGLFHMLHVAA